jgi:cardiolipin synthase
MFDWGTFWLIVLLVYLATMISVAIMIILERRSPHKTAAWVLALILLPVLGVLFYLFFGQEYRKQKMFSRKGVKSLGKFRRLSSVQLREISDAQLNLSPAAVEKEKIIRLLLNNSNSVFTTGNNLKLLNNGRETFDAIFKAIRAARHHIHLEYYIIENDKIGNELKNLLIEKRRDGVEVRIIVDDVGSRSLGEAFMDELRENGVEIYSFMEIRFPSLTSRVNYRNHRKIIVIDGKTGFTGGVNFADRYLEGLKGIGPWRDTHLQLEGDAVACLQVVFAADWYFVINENLVGKKYFPPLTESPGIPVQIAASGPDSDWENISQAFFTAFSGAQSRIYVATPYLMPPDHILAALTTAALSGIDVRIILPEKSDARISKWCSFSYIEGMLDAGIRVYFYQRGFIHSKVVVVDGIFSTLGTTNLDFRSLETNFEVNAFIYDAVFSAKIERRFTDDLRNSREIKPDEWKCRKWQNKLRESLAHIVSPML